jgi:hypothetical protein
MDKYRDDLDGCDDDPPPSGAWDRFIYKAIAVLVILLTGAVWADTALFGRSGEMGHANRFVYLAVFGLGGVSLFVRRLLQRLIQRRSLASPPAATDAIRRR